MKLNKVQIGRTLSQFRALVLAEDHPAVAQFCELFGHHTFFLDASGLNVLELLEVPGMHDVEDFLADVDADRGQGWCVGIHGMLLRVLRVVLPDYPRGGKQPVHPINGHHIARPQFPVC